MQLIPGLLVFLNLSMILGQHIIGSGAEGACQGRKGIKLILISEKGPLARLKVDAEHTLV